MFSDLGACTSTYTISSSNIGSGTALVDAKADLVKINANKYIEVDAKEYDGEI
jgi:hypothetical protein